MRRSFFSTGSILAALACVGTAGPAFAAAYSWTGNAGDADWSNVSNWSGGVPTSANDTTITFNTAVGVELATPLALTVKSISIGSVAGTFTIGKSGETSTFTLDHNSSATTIALSSASTKSQTINSNIIVNNTNNTPGTTAILGGTGSLIINGNLLMNTSTRVQAGSGGVILNGVLSGNNGGGGAALDINLGTVTFAGTSANTMTSRVNIASNTTLILAKTAGVDAIATSSVNINTSAILRLDASNQINDGVELSMRGGKFNLNTQTEALGKITLFAGASGIDLGSGSTTGLTVTNSSGGAAGITLTIDNWVDGKNYIRFVNAPSAAFLMYTSFTGYGSGAAATLKDGYYYITPAAVPEPASLGIVGLSAAALLWRKK